MKKIRFLILFSFFTSTFFAQDTIFKRNNDKIVAKISEITTTEIKYKKFNFQDGPLYVDKKTEIKMIIYSNGMKETFEVEKVKPVVNQATASSNNEIEDFELKYRYHGSYINQPTMQKILLSTKDKKIMGLVAQAKDARKMEFISFAAIPFGIAAIANLQFNSSQYTASSRNSVFIISGVCLAAAITCPIISGVKRKEKIRCNSEAISLYNQKF